MKQLFSLFLFLSLSIYAQEYTHIDDKVLKYSKYNSVEELASKINVDFTKDEDKVRAIYVWLTANIKYDLAEYYNPKKNSIRFTYSSEAEKQKKLKALKRNVANNTIRSKKSVCEGYAQTFKTICDLVGIKASVINGYARNNAEEIGRIPGFSDHAWNAIYLNNQWMIVDATWGAGRVINGKWEKHFSEYFYNISTKKVSLSHHPEEKKWQQIFNSPSIDTYFNQPIYKTKFLTSKAELISPTQGKLITKNNVIVLKIKNLPETASVLYTYNNGRQGIKPQFIRDGSIKNFQIERPKNAANLNVFINLKLALVFKVIPQ